MSNTNSHLQPPRGSFFWPFLKCNVAGMKTSPLHDVGARGSSCRHVSAVRVSLASDSLFNSPNLRLLRSPLNSLLLPCVWLQVSGRRWSEKRRRSALRATFELKWVWMYARASRMGKERRVRLYPGQRCGPIRELL